MGLRRLARFVSFFLANALPSLTPKKCRTIRRRLRVPLEDATVYSWDATYRAAVLETEPAKVSSRIDAAEKALRKDLLK
jgi:hypothetical protein